MTMSHEELAAPFASVNVTRMVPRCRSAADVTLLENERAHLLEHVHSMRSIDRVSRTGAYELRILSQQKIEAVPLRLAADLRAVLSFDNAPVAHVQRVASLNRERAEECAATERAASQAWSHLLSVFACVPPLP